MELRATPTSQHSTDDVDWQNMTFKGEKVDSRMFFTHVLWDLLYELFGSFARISGLMYSYDLVMKKLNEAFEAYASRVELARI